MSKHPIHIFINNIEKEFGTVEFMVTTKDGVEVATKGWRRLRKMQEFTPATALKPQEKKRK